MPDITDMFTFLSGAFLGSFLYVLVHDILDLLDSKNYKDKYDIIEAKAQMLKDENLRLARQNEKLIAFIRERM